MLAIPDSASLSPADESEALTLVAKARTVLAQAKTLPELRTVKEWAGSAADAARRWRKLAQAQEMRQQALAAEMDAHDLRVDATRLEGQMLTDLRETGERVGGRPAKESDATTLSRLGYKDRDEPARAMQIAAVPEKVLRDYKAERRERQEPASLAGLIRYAADASKRIQAEATALPDGCFRTIVIDPPWPMSKSDRIDYPEQGSRLEYPVMTLKEIAALPIPTVSSDGTHLYLWVTQRFLPEGLALIERWGFRYHCLLTWTKPGGFTPFTFMFNTEHAIFAYRPPLELARVGVKIGFAADARGHSVKPEAFYALAEEASFAPRLELFARRVRPGWTVWGDEV